LNRKTKKQITTVVVAIFFLSAGLWYAYQTKKPEVLKQEKTELTSVLSSTITEETLPSDSSVTEKEPEVAELIVHVCGAVKSPGVYTLSEGSRLHEAVTAADGFLPEADTMYHNLARNVKDGERIYILSCEETKQLTI